MHNECAYSLEAYDYFLPPELIAQQPASVRDASRLMVLDTHAADQQHLSFHELPRLFRAGDVLALNNTRVFPARLLGHKESGGRIEVFLLGFPAEEAAVTAGQTATARALLKSSKRARSGTRLFFDETLTAEVTELFEDGSASVRLRYPAGQSLEALLSRRRITSSRYRVRYFLDSSAFVREPMTVLMSPTVWFTSSGFLSRSFRNRTMEK